MPLVEPTVSGRVGAGRGGPWQWQVEVGAARVVSAAGGVPSGGGGCSDMLLGSPAWGKEWNEMVRTLGLKCLMSDGFLEGRRT